MKLIVIGHIGGDFDKWQTGINYLHTELDKYGLNEK